MFHVKQEIIQQKINEQGVSRETKEYATKNREQLRCNVSRETKNSKNNLEKH